jgi:hypothetical protein
MKQRAGIFWKDKQNGQTFTQTKKNKRMSNK